MKVRKIYKSIFILLMITSLSFINAISNESIVKSEYGSVNWSQKYFDSFGSSSLENSINNIASNELITQKNASEQGYKNLFKLIVNQYFDSKNRIVDLIIKDPKLTQKLNQYIKQATISDIINDANVRKIHYKLPFVIGNTNLYECLGLKRSYNIEIETNKNFIHDTKFTGIVIDARGLSLNQSITMRILSQERKIFFSFDNVKWEYIKKHKYITYVENTQNMSDYEDIIGKNPYKFAALDSYGINNTDLIISNRDINILVGNKENLDLLYMSKIIVIVDKK